MCLIIHKPPGVQVPRELIQAAAAFNRDGWGLMGFDRRGVHVERHGGFDLERVVKRLQALRQADLCVHLRLRTRGGGGVENAHPLRVTDRFHLMHNGTLRLPVAAGQSDSRQLAEQILRPLLASWPDLPAHPAFRALIEAGLSPDNKLVLFDTEALRFTFLNHHHGAMFEGLWLSSTRWLDRRTLPLAGAPQPQERLYRADELRFL